MTNKYAYLKSLSILDLSDDIYGKIHGGPIKNGSRIFWMYKGESNYSWSGIIFADQETQTPYIDSELDIESCLVCVDKYPIEKEYCLSYWTSIIELSMTNDLHGIMVT